MLCDPFVVSLRDDVAYKSNVNSRALK